MNRQLTLLATLTATAGLAAGFTALRSGTTIQPEHAEAHKPAHAEHHTDDGLDAAVKGIYAVISGPAGQKRDWDAFAAMFTDDAVMGQCVMAQDGTPRYIGFTPAQYVEQNAAFLEEGGFFEQETGRQVQRFGQMVHVWSTYQARRTEDGEVFMRGINSIQMVDMGEAGWKVRSIFWNPETPNNPLPEHGHDEEHEDDHEG